MGSYLRVLPVFLTLHSCNVTLFTLGLRLFFILFQNKQQGSLYLSLYRLITNNKNLPCDTHSDLQRSHLSDSLLLVILLHQKFDGKQSMIDLIILLWSWCRTCVFLSHSPSLSRFSPSVSTQSSVQVDVIVPLLCSRNVSSSVVFFWTLPPEIPRGSFVVYYEEIKWDLHRKRIWVSVWWNTKR